MNCIYEASSGLEAHMILNLLKSYGIEGRIEGEYLQGGAGELQAMNMVRVMVNESDFANAQSIIDDWDNTQVEKTRAPVSTKKLPGVITGLIFGLIFGAGITIWAYHTPILTDGIDYNGDGNFDEIWIYHDERIRRVETDRNLDGNFDSISVYDRKGKLFKIEMDENFDGNMETTIFYDKRGNPTKSESDTNGDGRIDYRALYKNGVFFEDHILDPISSQTRKILSYDVNKLKTSKFDSDGDGVYEIVTEYDYYENIE